MLSYQILAREQFLQEDEYVFLAMVAEVFVVLNNEAPPIVFFLDVEVFLIDVVLVGEFFLVYVLLVFLAQKSFEDELEEQLVLLVFVLGLILTFSPLEEAQG